MGGERRDPAQRRVVRVRGTNERAGRHHLDHGRPGHRGRVGGWRGDPRPWIVTAVHPKITFLRQLDRADLPADFVHDIENWKSRSGVVQIDCALDRLPSFPSNPEITDLSGGVELAHSIAYLDKVFEEARAGRPATAPFSDGVVPTIFDRTLAPEGHHIISLFTQWVPHEWSEKPHTEELEPTPTA